MHGWGSVAGTHVSVFVHFMRREFNNWLVWPFRFYIRELDESFSGFRILLRYCACALLLLINWCVSFVD